MELSDLTPQTLFDPADNWRAAPCSATATRTQLRNELERQVDFAGAWWVFCEARCIEVALAFGAILWSIGPQSHT